MMPTKVKKGLQIPYPLNYSLNLAPIRLFVRHIVRSVFCRL